MKTWIWVLIVVILGIIIFAVYGVYPELKEFYQDRNPDQTTPHTDLEINPAQPNAGTQESEDNIIENNSAVNNQQNDNTNSEITNQDNELNFPDNIKENLLSETNSFKITNYVYDDPNNLKGHWIYWGYVLKNRVKTQTRYDASVAFTQAKEWYYTSYLDSHPLGGFSVIKVGSSSVYSSDNQVYTEPIYDWPTNNQIVIGVDCLNLNASKVEDRAICEELVSGYLAKYPSLLQ